jgi:hypothetical protein
MLYLAQLPPDENGLRSFITGPCMAELGIGRANVCQGLRELVAAGWVSIVKDDRETGGRAIVRLLALEGPHDDEAANVYDYGFIRRNADACGGIEEGK